MSSPDLIRGPTATSPRETVAPVETAELDPRVKPEGDNKGLGRASVPRFAANISMLFTERPLLERPAAARAAGFDAIEVQFPYSIPLDDFARAVEAANVKVALINFPAGNAEK